MKALVIDDEKTMADSIKLALNFRWPDTKVLTAATGRQGMATFISECPDLVILDLNLPDTSGINVLREIRNMSAVPVIIHSVNADDDEVMIGLESGADDYIPKPCNYMTFLSPRQSSAAARSA